MYGRRTIDWHDKDVKHLNHEYIAVTAILSAIVATVLILGAIL